MTQPPSNDQSPWQSSTGGGHDGDGGTTGQRPEYHRPPTSPFPAADEPTQSTAQPTTSPYPAAYGSVPTTPYGQSGAQYGQSGASYGQTGAGYGQTGTAYGQTDAAAAPYGQAGPASVGAPAAGAKSTGFGKRAALITGVAALALASGGIGGVVGANVDRDPVPAAVGGDRQGDGAPQKELPAPAGSVQAVAAKVLPSVVSIAVRVGNQEGEGSGVVLDTDGTIMTNNHVVAGGGGRRATGTPSIIVIFQDGSRAQAELRGADPISDIAVLQVKNKPSLQPITIGTSKNLAVGQDVIAIGSPLGLAGTVTTGIISAINRPVSTSRVGDSTAVIDAIQTDAAINPGNSGGALVNARGALIGINTAIATLGGSDQNGEARASGSIGLGFAIPIDQAMRVADQLRKTGKAQHPSLGVSVGPASTTDPTQSGARITKIVPGGAAAEANIPDGAVIHTFGGRTITSADDLVAAVRSFAPGDSVDVAYTAGGKPQTARVTLKTLATN